MVKDNSSSKSVSHPDLSRNAKYVTQRPCMYSHARVFVLFFCFDLKGKDEWRPSRDSAAIYTYWTLTWVACPTQVGTGSAERRENCSHKAGFLPPIQPPVGYALLLCTGFHELRQDGPGPVGFLALPTTAGFRRKTELPADFHISTSSNSYRYIRMIVRCHDKCFSAFIVSFEQSKLQTSNIHQSQRKLETPKAS